MSGTGEKIQSNSDGTAQFGEVSGFKVAGSSGFTLSDPIILTFPNAVSTTLYATDTYKADADTNHYQHGLGYKPVVIGRIAYYNITVPTTLLDVSYSTSGGGFGAYQYIVYATDTEIYGQLTYLAYGPGFAAGLVQVPGVTIEAYILASAENT